MINETTLNGGLSEQLLKEIATWEKVTTIILHGGSVFEFKGPFPKGSHREGFYNLEDLGLGFSGHLNLDQVDHVAFQDKKHRGRESLAFVFVDKNNCCIFKIFVGRNSQGELITEQVTRFREIQSGKWLNK